MRQQFSKIEPTKLLYSIVRREDITSYRTDASPDTEYLQLSARSIANNTTIKAHKHIPFLRETKITQEAWIILQGSVEGCFYDLDDRLIERVIFNQGDSVVLFRGGHKLTTLKEDTILYEIKTGPYYGQETDKQHIE